MDKNDLKIKMVENAVWVNLTDAGSVSNVTFNASATQRVGVVMGAQSSTAEGVLVLEANNKALVLPRVASPEANVKSPPAGMMVYDTTSKSLALFDGLKWNYWK